MWTSASKAADRPRRRIADGYVVTAADAKAELRRIGHALKPLEIDVVNTRAGSPYGNLNYTSAGWTRAVAIFEDALMATAV